MWRGILSWLLLGDHLVTASGTLLTVATLFAFVEKYKFLAIVKITSMLFPVSFASVSLPHFATSWNPEESSAIILSLRELATDSGPSSSRLELSSAVFDDRGLSTKYYAQVKTRSVLFRATERGLIRSRLYVEEGTWVLAGDQVAETTGRRWIHIMLPDPDGHFVSEVSPVGYVPLDHIGEKRASLPAR